VRPLRCCHPLGDAPRALPRSATRRAPPTAPRRTATTNATVSALAPGLSSSTLTSFPAPSPAQPLLGALSPCIARRCSRAKLSPQRTVQRILGLAAVRWGPCRARHLDLLYDGLRQQRRGRGGSHERGRSLAVCIPTNTHRHSAMDAVCRKRRPGAHRSVHAVWQGRPARD
jgi:hypothetical protein